MAVVGDAGITGEVGVVARLLVDPGVCRRGLGGHLLERAWSDAARQDRTPVLDVAASATNAIGLMPSEGLGRAGKVHVRDFGSRTHRGDHLHNTALKQTMTYRSGPSETVGQRR